MAKRRKKQGGKEAEAAAVLVVFAVLYLTASRHLSVFKLAAFVGVAGFAIAIGIVLLRGRRRLAGDPQPNQTSQRREPSPYKAPQANPGPDVLDRVRTPPTAAPAITPLTSVPAPTKPAAWSLPLIKELEWKRFEELCEGYWKAKGYRAELTGRGADGGIDINLYRPSAPDKLLVIIQCKSRSRENIGVATVRELFGVMHHVKAPMGILLTSTGFYPAAREFAAGKHLQLVDGETLYRQLVELPEADSRQLLEHVTRDDYITPTCPNCDVKMVKRVGKSSGDAFYGCRNYPRCRQTLQVRGA